jgi:predicted transcriptional regulator
VSDYNFSELFTLTEKGEKFLDDFKAKFEYQKIDGR